MLNLMAIGEEM